MANALVDFFVAEVKAFSLSPAHLKTLREEAYAYFSTYPIVSLGGQKVQFVLDDAQARHLYEHFIVLILPMLEKDANFFQWIAIKIWLGLGGKNQLSWEEVKKSFSNKKLPAALDTFVDDIWGIVRILNMSFASSYGAEMMTIGEYFTLVTDFFPNPAFQSYVASLPKWYLQLPISRMDYNELIKNKK